MIKSNVWLMSLAAIFLLISCGKPTRSECIVLVNIQWEDEVNLKDKNSAYKSFFDFVYKNMTAYGSPSFSVQGVERNELYIQFSNRCDKKYLLAERMLIEYGSEPFSHARVINKVIYPSTRTISVHGESWRE
ncbi:MAG: hypothetical protein HUJ29_06135 [Gammaproteobacteria bacterium]|nr:hypothetical protein [Gammaproteobacteria bacterium]